ncbi:MAG: hypothetical protein OXQ31_17285 [Spirochaetaceae bacterium]|nr:hypothetical protein [Spirochaetaceae bacterium]
MEHAEQSRRAAVMSKQTQLRIWRSISGSWEDDRSTERIIADIYDQRTPGREVNLRSSSTPTPACLERWT